MLLTDLGKKCDVYEVILNPGDILIVPTNWWHYVENLELSLTVNTWIPLEQHDAFARLEECFVRTQIEKITESDDCGDDVEDFRRYIFNPNEVRVLYFFSNTQKMSETISFLAHFFFIDADDRC